MTSPVKRPLTLDARWTTVDAQNDSQHGVGNHVIRDAADPLDRQRMLVDVLDVDRLHDPHRRHTFRVSAFGNLAVHALQVPPHEVPRDRERESLSLEDDRSRETGELAQVGGRKESVGEVFGDQEAGDWCCRGRSRKSQGTESLLLRSDSGGVSIETA